jgi:hypothetical protein
MNPLAHAKKRQGRPNTTGLSLKKLGRHEYFRRYRSRKLGRPIAIKPRWTGLSLKQLGWAEYMHSRRNLIANGAA